MGDRTDKLTPDERRRVRAAIDPHTIRVNDRTYALRVAALHERGPLGFRLNIVATDGIDHHRLELGLLRGWIADPESLRAEAEDGIKKSILGRLTQREQP
jgi:hypothetical protein